MGILSSQLISREKKFISLRKIYSLIIIAFGAGLAIFGVHKLLRAKASVDWPIAQGIVAASSVESHRNSDGNTKDIAAIVYEFSVDGIIFNGERVVYGDRFYKALRIDSIIDRYPEGKSVTVHYMPDNPEECLLEPGIKLWTWLYFAFGIFIIGIGILSASYKPESMKKKDITEPSHREVDQQA